MSGTRLRIIADANIAFVEQAFAQLGSVRAVPSTELTPERLRDADLVLVRSTIKVDAALLGGSRARFVATATIGTDHFDTAWLEEHGIAWAAAPGSNADSVVQWCAAALLTLAERRGQPWAGQTLGVVGVGAIGRKVVNLGRALGCAVLRCDPPRARAEGDEGFVGLDDLLAASDVISLHVPLNRDGRDQTVGLLDGERLGRIKPGAAVLNASRGEVIAGPALIDAHRAGRVRACALDVFPDEPEPAPSLVEAADLATPHIAGHSLDGKAAGTLMIYLAACEHLGVEPRWTPARALPPPPVKQLALDTRSLSDEAAALHVLRRFYRIEDDDAALRRMVSLPVKQRAAAFRRYRNDYPERRELSGLRVNLQPFRPRAQALLEVLGARVATPEVD
jgi:erythronate-4-phosphate dehydrogenase